MLSKQLFILCVKREMLSMKISDIFTKSIVNSLRFFMHMVQAIILIFMYFKE